MTSTSNNKGSATILIMLMAGVIVTVGLGFNWLVKEHIKSSEGLKNKTEAILKARSAYDTLIYLILNGRVLQKEILLTGTQGLTTLTSIPLNGKEVNLADDLYLKVQDSNGLLSLSIIDSSAIGRLIRNVGKVQNPVIATESLLDWIDPDDFSRINGAETAYYRGQQQAYKPRNYALQYKEELAFVRDVGRDVYGKISPYLTILPASGFNPNTASDEVLKAYLDIGGDTLTVLKDYMNKAPLTSNSVLFPLTGRQLSYTFEEMHFYPSRFMEVTVRVGSPRSLCTIKAGLNFVNYQNAPYGILYWQED